MTWLATFAHFALPALLRLLLPILLLSALILMQGATTPDLAAQDRSPATASNPATVVGSTAVDSGSFWVVPVSCPTGTMAVGGGVDPSDILDEFVTSSGPKIYGTRLLFIDDGANAAPDGWQASIVNHATASMLFKVGVICADAASVTSVVASATVSSRSYGSVSASCPAGKVAVGGGTDPENIYFESVSSSGPTWGGIRLLNQADGANSVPDGWQASIINHWANPGILKVAVICMDESSASSTVASTTVPSGGSDHLSLSCPAGKFAAGGGIDPYDIQNELVSSSGPTWSDSLLLNQADGANPAPDGWQASIINQTGSPASVKAAVICVPTAYALSLPLVLR